MNTPSVGRLPEWLLGLLRLPLFYKIVVANGALLAALGTLAIVLPPLAGGENGWLLPVWAGGVILMIALNGALVHLALLPLRNVEETAGRIEAGDTGARVPRSPLADRNFARVVEVVNGMLDSVEEARLRHQRLSAQLARVEEAERKRIARELFDDIAQVLSAALLQLQLAQHRLGSRSGGEERQAAEAALESARAGILDALAGIQRIARGLRPPELDELGPLAALEVHGRQITEETGVPVRITGSLAETRLSPPSSLALYRILQEGMASAVLHGSPSAIRVEVGAADGRVRAVLQADGGGLADTTSGDDPEEYAGLLRMHERARQAGGGLTVESDPEAGTRLTLVLPGEPAPAARREGPLAEQSS